MFFLQTQQIEVRLVTITIEFDSTLAYTPFHFSPSTPINNIFFFLLGPPGPKGDEGSEGKVGKRGPRGKRGKSGKVANRGAPGINSVRPINQNNEDDFRFQF